jgi:hypothetical protein
MNFIFGYTELLLLNKFLTYNEIYAKKILFEKINLILQTDEKELENNIEKYDEILDQIISFSNKNYSHDYEEIDKLLLFEKMLFELVELDFLCIDYYVEFISNQSEKFLLTYSNILRTKNYTLDILENDYRNKSKKIIAIIKKNIYCNNN